MTLSSTLPRRKLGKDGPEVVAVGLGLMGLSIGYGPVGSDEERLEFLDKAWELGCTNWDSSDMYGDSEVLIGKWFKLHPERRQDIFLATKFGIKAESLDSTPEYASLSLNKSLERLGVDYIDLYYIHRLDGVTPIEKTMEVLRDFKREGKIKHIGISECSSATLRRAHAVAPVAAVQIEYSPWEIAVETEEGTYLQNTCRELGVAIVAYSPLGRGMLTGQIRSPNDLTDHDFRKYLPRYSEENFDKNLELVTRLQGIAQQKGCTASQLALSWLLAQGQDIIPIPGTKNVKFLEENLNALSIELTPEEENKIRDEVNRAGSLGFRYPEILRSTLFADTPEP